MRDNITETSNTATILAGPSLTTEITKANHKDNVYFSNFPSLLNAKTKRAHTTNRNIEKITNYKSIKMEIKKLVVSNSC
jgi:hypothetical protein